MTGQPIGSRMVPMALPDGTTTAVEVYGLPATTRLIPSAPQWPDMARPAVDTACPPWCGVQGSHYHLGPAVTVTTS